MKPLRPRLTATLLMASLLAAAPLTSHAAPPPLQTTTVAAQNGGALVRQDGTVEAVRQAVLSAQVAGAVTATPVKAGDRVRAGQVLLRLDARSAEQQAQAASAQVLAAQATLAAARQDLQRQRALHQQQFISAAALERAETQFKASQAQADAQVAAAQAARTGTSHFTVTAPFDGVVADVTVVLGDMVMPGRPLLTVYDPQQLRVAVAVPESQVAALRQGGTAASNTPLQVALSTAPEQAITPLRAEWLPAADSASHTQTLRLHLPPGTPAVPGQAARAWLPQATNGPARLAVPLSSLVQRGELRAVYVITAEGRPLLRQVRLGARRGEQVEVLSGLAQGERVALQASAVAGL